MHARCGEDLLIPVRSVRSWNARISAHARHGHGHDAALQCFEAMLEAGISPDAFTYASVLKACSIAGWMERGEEIHGELLRRDLLREDAVLGAALVDLYARCGEPGRGEEVLGGLRARDVVCWNALISGYVQQGLPESAFECLAKMRREQIAPDPVTFICIMRACGSSRELRRGKRIHAQLICISCCNCSCKLDRGSCCKLDRGGCCKLDRDNCCKLDRGSRCKLDRDNCCKLDRDNRCNLDRDDCCKLHRDAILGTAVVDMYAKCGDLAGARRALERLPLRSAASWNAMICGYARRGRCEEAVESWELMRSEGLAPDAITFTCILKACCGSAARSIEKGGMIHQEIVSKGLLEEEEDDHHHHHHRRRRRGELGNALVDMYARCGAPEEAYAALAALASPSIVSWNAMISGFVHRGRDEAAMECFDQILARGFCPNAITFTSLLKACASAGDLRKGERAHDEVARRGFAAGDDGIVGTALVEMYARCGVASAARRVHARLLRRDAVSWCALISGCADHGLGDEALGCFRRMLEDGFPATAPSLACLLSACSHSGLVDEGEAVYLNMGSAYGVPQSLEHHACAVDLLGRSGQLEKAAALVSRLPSSDHYPPVLGAFMGACHKWRDLGLAKLAFSRAMQCRRDDDDDDDDDDYGSDSSAAYVCFANICSASGPAGDPEDVVEKPPSRVDGK